MRKRYQKGRLKNVEGSWIAQWWEDGHRRKRTLGRVSKMTKTQVASELAEILSPINGCQVTPSATYLFGEFVERIYLPFYRRKWKHSTVATNENRVEFHLTSEFSARTLGSFNRD